MIDFGFFILEVHFEVYSDENSPSSGERDYFLSTLSSVLKISPRDPDESYRQGMSLFVEFRFLKENLNRAVYFLLE